MTRTATRDSVTDRWTLTGPERTVEFLHVCGAFGYGDPSEEGDYGLNAAAVLGLQIDKSLVVLDEAVGTIEEVGLAAVEVKDRLDLETFYIDPEPVDYKRRLMAIDGLTHYQNMGLDALNRKKYVRSPEHWPHFRGRDCLVSLVPVREAVLADYESYVSRLEVIRGTERLLVADWCPKTRLLSRETFDTGRKHPLMKAIVYALAGMLSMMEEPVKRSETTGNTWYGNIR